MNEHSVTATDRQIHTEHDALGGWGQSPQREPQDGAQSSSGPRSLASSWPEAEALPLEAAQDGLPPWLDAPWLEMAPEGCAEASTGTPITSRQNTKLQAKQPPHVQGDPSGGALAAGLGSLSKTPRRRQLTGLMLDGGTTLRRENWTLAQSSSAIRALVTEARRRKERGEAARDARTDRPLFLMLRGLDGSRAKVAARVWTTGPRGQTIHVNIEKVVHVQLDTEREVAKLQLKAGSLWAEGAAAVMAWLTWAFDAELFSQDAEPRWERSGDYLETVTQADAHGWRVSHIELCADFMGLSLTHADLTNFVGRAKCGSIDPLKVDSWGRSDGVETVNVGRRSSPVSLCYYLKTLQILQAKGGDGSFYEPAWREAGWDGESQVGRLELRANGHGLCIERGDDIVDLRRLPELLNPARLATWWRVQTEKKRLVVPDDQRIERCTTDPRWSFLQELAPAPAEFDPQGWRQRREVQRGTALNMVKRAGRQALRCMSRLAGVLGWLPEQTAHLPVDSARTRREWVAAMVDTLFAVASDVGDGAAAELVDYGHNHREQFAPFLAPEFELLSTHVTHDHPRTALAPKVGRKLPRRPLLGPDFWDAWGGQPEPVT